MNNVVKNLAAVAAFAFCGSAALAQTQTPPPAPAHQGILSRLFHPKPKPGTMMPMHPGMTGARSYSTMGTHPMMGGSMMGGRIIGNKKTHVFHMPGDTSALPAPQNRVYFSSAAAAQAAGYHAAGGHMMTHQKMMMQH